MLLVAGSAAATYPLPPFEESIVINNTEVGIMEDEILDKHPGIGEKCLPRRAFCVGPFDPDIDIGLGQTGARLLLNDTNVTYGHDPTRHQQYGPYVVPTVVSDDIRLCWNGCIVPYPFYVSVEGNATIELYALGNEIYSTSVRVDRDVQGDMGLVPRKFCNLAMHGCQP